MRSRSRALTAVAVLALIGLVVSGCVSEKSADTPDNTQRNANAKKVTLTISDNSIVGGKNSAKAAWFTKYVVPKFEAKEKKKGVNVKVKFQANGVDDEKYSQKLELALKAGSGPDIFPVDGPNIGPYAGAGYIKPLSDVVGKHAVESWKGWDQIPKSVQQNAVYEHDRYGVPYGTDGRVLFFNKKLFARAGLPADWQPKSWADILDAARKLNRLPGVTPIQIDAGVPMGEATTMQGFLPLLQGTGEPIYEEKAGEWQGDTENVRQVLGFYQKLYGGSGLGDPNLQKDTNGRDQSFAAFAHGKLGIIAESDYLWRSVICPSKKTCGATAMKNRNEVVGFAKIPARKPGSGVRGQDFVSMSGGGIYVVNPNTKYPQQTWDLLNFIASPAAIEKRLKLQGAPQITANSTVNKKLLSNDPLLSYVADEVLPITSYRPAREEYSSVTALVQEATAGVVSGKSIKSAAHTYGQGVQKAVGAKNVDSG